MLKSKIFRISCLLGIAVMVLSSCAEYKAVPCPDFSDNRNFNPVKKDHHKTAHHPGGHKKSAFFAFRFKPGVLLKQSKIYPAFYPRQDYIAGKDVAQGLRKEDNKMPEAASLTVLPDERENSYSERMNLSGKNNVEIVFAGSGGVRPVIGKVAGGDIRTKPAGIRQNGKQVKNHTFTDDNHSVPAGGDTRTGEGMAIASFVLGVLGLIVLGIPFGIMSVVFGSTAIGRIRRSGVRSGRGMAIAGIVLGIVDIIGVLIVLTSL